MFSLCVETDRQVAVYCYVSDAPSAKSFVKNARTCAFVVALMYWVVHAMLNASVILPPWPSRPTGHWKTAFCYSTCIYTFVHTHHTAWRGRLYTYRYTVTTRMTSALRWAAMRAILMFQ